jgi:1-acyl-sn-glycerol-3-phosphate acyltransferase
MSHLDRGAAGVAGAAPSAAAVTGRSHVLPPQRPWLHHASRSLLRPVFRLYFGMRAEGLARLPAQGPYLLAPNHVSMLDWAFLSYFLPRLTRFVVHREYYDQPAIGFGLRVNGAIPVRTGRPDLGAMRSARAVLAAGEALILFPEGGISRTGRPGPAQPGIIALAATAGAPIVPVAIRGAFEAFPRWRRLPRPRRITVAFGSPLPPPPLAACRRHHQVFADRLMEHIAALLDGRPQPSSGWPSEAIGTSPGGAAPAEATARP